MFGVRMGFQKTGKSIPNLAGAFEGKLYFVLRYQDLFAPLQANGWLACLLSTTAIHSVVLVMAGFMYVKAPSLPLIR